MVLLGVVLAKQILGIEVPAAVNVLAENDPTALELSSQVLQRLFEDGRTPTEGQITRFSLSVRERLRDKMKFAVASIFLPRRLHFQLIPLPGPILSFCVFPIKLLCDYWRIAWPAQRTLTRV
jgi:hypothetical protein